MNVVGGVWSKRWTLLPLGIGTWNTVQWVRHVEGADVSHWLRAHPPVTAVFLGAIFIHLGWWKATPHI